MANDRRDQISQTPVWLRGLALGLGISILLWLPFEDQHTKWAIGFGSAVAAWFAARAMIRYQLSRTAQRAEPQPLDLLVRYTLIGLLAGLAISPLSLFLMVFKTGLHAHGVPDFTLEQMKSVLHRTPIFGLSGLLLSLGSGFAVLFRSKKHANCL